MRVAHAFRRGGFVASSVAAFACGVVVTLTCSAIFRTPPTGGHPSTALQIKEGSFSGAQWRTAKTLAATVLFESPWVRFEDHTVLVRGGEEPAQTAVAQQEQQKQVIRGWKWIDVPDQVNVLATEWTSPRVDGNAARSETFVLFRQEKYGYVGTSLAVVGGLIEAGESPVQAARRELSEELGFTTCREWVLLGRWRVDTNRGLGTVSSFLARGCSRETSNFEQRDALNTSSEARAAGHGDVHGRDRERQVVVRMSLFDAAKALRSHQRACSASNVAGHCDHIDGPATGPVAAGDAHWNHPVGAIKEVKWANTIALSLLYLQTAS